MSVPLDVLNLLLWKEDLRMRKGTKIHILDTQRFSIGAKQLQHSKS